MKRHNRLLAYRGAALACVVLSLGFAYAGGGGSINDKLARFSTPGPDRYADGSIVVDGECYALVWSPAGTTFSGFNADGTPVSATDRVVLAGALAKGGKCPEAIFQIPAKDYEELDGGEWAVCLVDTRMANGVPAGVRDGKPLRVNRWGAVKGGVKVEPQTGSSMEPAASSNGALRLAATPSTSQPVRATTLSAVPPTAKRPTITDFDFSDGEVWLEVSDTVPYFSYTIISGETPNDLKVDYFSEVVDGGINGGIVIGTGQSPNRRFFKVKRAE